tara:strand:+ start:319 stop:534 length:216 start_codon:yes stop_codon:yes gene_type:complete
MGLGILAKAVLLAVLVDQEVAQDITVHPVAQQTNRVNLVILEPMVLVMLVVTLVGVMLPTKAVVAEAVLAQ